MKRHYIRVILEYQCSESAETLAVMQNIQDRPLPPGCIKLTENIANKGFKDELV
jgi:predicted nucleic acid-binding Zn ribbon protein